MTRSITGLRSSDGRALLTRAACVLIVAAAGCSTPANESGEDAEQSGVALSGSDWRGNVADHECNVVMREAFENYVGRTGPETDCSTGTCWVIVHGTFDVASSAIASLTGAPSVAWQGGDHDTWRNVAATPVHGAGYGYRRYAFEIREHTFANTQDAGSMQLIAYAPFSNGVYYDHNFNVDEFQNYSLDVSNGWTLSADASATCPAPAPAGEGTVRFRGDFTQATSGELASAGKLYVDYDIYRLPQCMNSYTHGFPAWATLAHVKFQPSGALSTLVVSGPRDASGRWTSLPLELDVPPSSTRVEFWFSTSGEGCATNWDSNFGANFAFAIDR